MDRVLWLYPDGDLTHEPERWCRTGECIRCGACCGGAERPSYAIGWLGDEPPPGLEEDDGTEEEGWESAPIVVEDWDGRPLAWQRTEPEVDPCPQYRDGLCAVYGTEEYPHVCRKFPLFPDDVPPSCGFRFVRI